MKALKYPLHLVLLLVVVGAVGVGLTAWQSGYRAYAVQTGSMTPTFPTGSLVIDAPPSRPVAVGDVITFRTPDGLVTHRVHDVLPQGIRTKGDGNRTTDPWTLDRDQVVGVVSWGAAYLGYVFVFFQQPTGVVSLMLLALSVYLAWSIFFSDTSVETPTRSDDEQSFEAAVITDQPVADAPAMTERPSFIVLPGDERVPDHLDDVGPTRGQSARSGLLSA